MKTGRAHDKRFSEQIGSVPAGPVAVKLHEEPAEPILLLGEMVRDCGIAKDMLAGLAFASRDDYRRNLRVVKAAADRLSQRAAVLIGDE